MNSNKQSGFSAVVSIIAIVLVVSILGLIGWRLYSHLSKQTNNTNSNNQNTSRNPVSNNNQTSTPSQPADPYAGWLSYTSQVGNFTFRYPSTWTIDPTVGDPVYGPGSVVRLTNDSNTKTDNFGLNMQITDKSHAINYGPSTQGSSTNLPNGVSLWQDDQHMQSDSSPCPILGIGNNDATYMPLKNGKYLSVYGSYCWKQDLTPTALYHDQINSQPWKDAVNILASIKFN